MLETSLPEEEINEISLIIKNVSGVKDFHKLKTRKIGNSIAIEAHIKVNKDLSVEASHNIASEIEKLFRNKFGPKTHIGIHIEPYYEK